MPIYSGTSTSNPLRIYKGDKPIQRVYVGNNLVWQKQNENLFDTYIAPIAFDRAAQPVDIYDVFEKYYRNNRDAKYIYSVADSFPDMLGLGSNEMALHNHGTSHYWGWEENNIKHTQYARVAYLPGNLSDGYYNTITVDSTETFPESGKIVFGDAYTPYYQGYGWTPFFVYTSKDATHFYGVSQRVGSSDPSVRLVIDWGGKTKRWVITNNSSNSGMGKQVCYVGNRLKGPEWLYCGKDITDIMTSDASAGYSSIKYIHCHSVDNLSIYSYCCHYGGYLSGALKISKSATLMGGINFWSSTANITGDIEVPENIISIGDYAFYMPGITSYKFYHSVAPTVSLNSFSAHAKPLHIKAGATGFNVAPWTNTAIFSEIIADL